MRWLSSAIILTICFCALPAQACVTASFAYFDFGPRTLRGYEDPEGLKYFIGRVMTFGPPSDTDQTPAKALIKVLKEYNKGLMPTRVLGLPDVAIFKIEPAGGCTGYELDEGDVGVFGYFERDGELWLAWQKGGF